VILAKVHSLNGFETPYSLEVFASNQECSFSPCFFLIMISKHIPINDPLIYVDVLVGLFQHVCTHCSERHGVVHCAHAPFGLTTVKIFFSD
jgi:hypothetical protein